MAWDQQGRRATTARVGSPYRCVAEESINHLEMVRLPLEDITRHGPPAWTALTPSTPHGGHPRSRAAPVATTMASSVRCSRSISWKVGDPCSRLVTPSRSAAADARLAGDINVAWRAPAAHLRMSVQELEKRLRGGYADLLSIMLGAPTIAAAYRYWAAGQGQNGSASSADNRATP